MLVAGVLVFLLTLLKNLKIIPSLPMAYKILGKENNPPNKQVQNANIAPIFTIHKITGHSNCLNTYGNGVSGFYI